MTIEFTWRTVSGGPLQQGQIFQPAGPVRVYRVESEVLDNLVLPSGVHAFDDRFAGNPVTLIVCAGAARAEVEQIIGSAAELVGVYTQNGTELVFHDALSFESVRVLVGGLVTSVEGGAIQSVRMPPDALSLLSPEYYPALLMPLIYAYAQRGMINEARELAEVVSWADPDLPSIQKFFPN